MIFEIIIYTVQIVVGKLTGFVFDPNAVLLKLPWGLDDYMVQGVAGYRIIAEAFPPFNTVLVAFGIYLLFKISMRLLKAVPLLGRTLD